MNIKLVKNAFLGLSLSIGLMASMWSGTADANMKQVPIVLETQGSFAVGGTTITHEGEFSMEHFLNPEGQKAYGDHAYVFYQIPVHAKKYPIVFQHGGAQTKRTWESTPDGRDGFQNIFLRKGYSLSYTSPINKQSISLVIP